MATKYGTNNPVGSSDPRDLFDNSIVIDEFANSSSETALDRRGVSRKTLTGLDAEFDASQVTRENEFDASQADKAQRFNQLLAASGYVFLADYAAGIEVTEYNEVIRDGSGNLWRAASTTTLPYTTTGTGLPESGAFVSAGDAVLRNDLMNSLANGQGALNVRGSVIYVDTIADLDSMDAAKLVDGQTVIVKRYKAGLEFGGGSLFWDASSTETPDGGSVFQLTGVTTGRFKRPPSNRLSVFDYGNTLAGLNAAIEKGRSFTGGFAVEGFPDYQVDTFSSAGPSFEYGLDGFDDHVRKVLDGVRLRGDGTNQLFFSNSSYAEILRCTFQDGDVGLHVGKFVNSAQKNHYTGNRLGLWLNGVTAHREEGIYARGNTEAAVYISGGATENVTLSGGAIEGNRGCAIKVDGATVTDSFRLTVNDVYFELDGDDGAGTPSIDIPSIGALVTFNGGKLSYNVSTWTSGPYILGSRAVMNGTRVSGRMFVDSISFVGGSKVDDLILRDNSSTDSEIATLAFVPEAWGLEWGPGASGVSGHIFSLPIKDAKSIRQSFDVAPTAHPYGARIVGTNPPTLTENTADDIGAGPWSRVEFTTSDGSPTNNAFRIGERRDVSGLDYCVMTALMKVNQNQKFSIVEIGGGTRFSQTLTLNTGKNYRVAFLINKSVSDLNDFRIYPRDTSAPILDIIVQNQSDFATQEEASQYLDSIA